MLEFLEEARFERAGVFTYSPQEGTRSAAMADDVPDEIKRERQERVVELQRLITGERYERMVGRHVRAVVDRAADDAGAAQARTEAQADDIDGVTWVKTDAPPGSLIEVRLDSVVDDYDFSATQVREVERARTVRPHRKELPTMSTASAYGR